MSFGTMGGGGGGGAKDVGTVTGGMNVMTYDDKTRPVNRNDLIDFLWDYDTNLNSTEKQLMFTSMAMLGVGLPLGGFIGNYFGRRFVRKHAKGIEQIPFRFIPRAIRGAFICSGCSIPYVAAQQWTVSRILELDDADSLLAFHTKRLMIVQRSSLMFSRSSAREVTREEQESLIASANKNRVGRGGVDLGSAAGKGGGAGRPGLDVNLALGQQVMTPVAQSGYQDMPKQ